MMDERQKLLLDTIRNAVMSMEKKELDEDQLWRLTMIGALTWGTSHPMNTPEIDLEWHISGMLRSLGEDPNREGLEGTPERVTRAWLSTWAEGYRLDPLQVLKTFQHTAVDQMVMLRDIPVYSHCEHHIAPFFGTAAVAYVPDGRIVGLSKVLRVVDIFAHRLQIQERLTNQIADAMMEGLTPLGVGVLLKCRHMCMESRGVQSRGTITVTNALRGVFMQDSPRAEFLRLADS